MEQETAKPGAAIIIIGDFNGASLKSSLPLYRQYISCTTRGTSILDLCYCNKANAYKSKQRMPLGASDHNMIVLQPTYVRRLKAVKPLTKTIKVWNQDLVEEVAGSYACTDWEMFSDACSSLHQLTDTICSYINFCIDSLVPEKKITIYSNNNPWMTRELKGLVSAKRRAERSGNTEAIRRSRRDLTEGIAASKRAYSIKLERLFDTDAKACWKGIKTISGYSKSTGTGTPQGQEVDWCDRLNQFYARFETADPLPSFGEEGASEHLRIPEEDVRKVFLHVKTNKAAGPDGITPWTLKTFAQELAPVFTNLFNQSLEFETVPDAWKSSIIVPVPKKPRPSELNDYRPVALTSVIMKCMERVVLRHLTAATAPLTDPMQFAYKSARGTDDACAVLTHLLHQHLDEPRTYARILYVDFSSAFNTMLPSVLIDKLNTMGVSPSLCKWILHSYLRHRTQRVRIGKTLSDPIVTNIGAPQGCVLSPVLFTHYTNNHRGIAPHTHIIKYADDTAIVGLIRGNEEEQHYRNTIHDFITSCDSEGLQLNVKKTKEMIIDFRKKPSEMVPINIKGEPIELCQQYKYLGLTITNDLTWKENTEVIKKKAMKKMHYLRLLKKFGVSPRILKSFYEAVVASTITFGIPVWGSSLTAASKSSIRTIIRVSERIIGQNVQSFEDIHENRCVKLATKIANDMDHPLSQYFKLLPSRRRLQSCSSRTNRLKNSFIPNSIRLLNAKRCATQISR
jgi:hypothetical protein